MDPTRFDAFSRTLTDRLHGGPTRRAILATLGGALLGGWLSTPLDGDAKRNRRKRHNRRKKRKCLFGQRRCKDRRCHGCCSDADCGGNVCEVGTCSACPQGQRPCHGGCIPEDACCDDSECTGGRVCVDGSCECGPNQRLCEGACIPASECCGTDCPTCSSENCDGCCDGHICRDGDSTNFCGRNGTICSACSFLQTCTGEFCACLRECCFDFDCPGENRRCNNQGFCESCVPNGGALPGGCTIETVSLCCSGQCSGAVCSEA